MNKRMVLLFSAVYFVSYLTRINFGAVIIEMVSSTGYTKSMFSLAITGSFITYGIGQVVTGLLGDKFNPKRLITIGFITTVLMNFAVSVCNHPYQMLPIWCINGFAQAFMWPPLIKIMTAYYSYRDFNRQVVWVSAGGNVGTILIYLAAPLLISLFNWRAMFIFSGFIGVIMILFWERFCPEFQYKQLKNNNNMQAVTYKKAKLFTPVILGVLIIMALQGMLRDGVTTWTPSYIEDNYKLGNGISILTGVIMPIFSIVVHKLANIIYERYFKSPIACAATFFTVGAVASLGLIFITGKSAVISVVLLALLVGSMGGTNYMLSCVVPAHYTECSNISTLSGLINSASYVGSATSTYGIAIITDNSGWGLTIIIWFIIAVLGSLIGYLTIPLWKKEFIK